MRSNNKRAAILEAALRVVEKEGANHLTIDAVAAEADLSKGGVLYHFASKKELLLGMIDQLIESHETRFERNMKSKGRFAAFLHLEDRMTAAEKRASLAILAASAENPELIESARRYMKQMIDEALIDVDPGQIDDALLLILANEGLRYLDILDLNPLTKAQTSSVVSQMGRLAGDL